MCCTNERSVGQPFAIIFSSTAEGRIRGRIQYLHNEQNEGALLTLDTQRMFGILLLRYTMLLHVVPLHSFVFFRKFRDKTAPNTVHTYLIPAKKLPNSALCRNSIIQLGCPSVTHWDCIITFTIVVQFQVQNQILVPHQKLLGACYLELFL